MVDSSINWQKASKRFINSFGIQQNKVTTQIEPHDWIAEVMHVMIRINNISIDLSQDMWTYISNDIFKMNLIEFRYEYLHFIYGQQKSYLSQVSANYGDITNDQEEGSGMKITVKYYIEKDMSIEFYMDYWDIADSKLDITGNFMEPRNTTSETGLRVLWSY